MTIDHTALARTASERSYPEDLSPPLIELRNIIKEYGNSSEQDDDQTTVRVLHGVSLSIHAGEFVAIIGASGSGKSTMMNILGCLDNPTAGEYFFSGQNVAEFDSNKLAWLRRSAFGFIFQGYHLIPSENAAENVAVPALYAGMPEPEREERAEKLLSRLGLGERMHYLPKQLSGGQQQRVSIARALMNGGSIILADEPTGALDSKTGIEVMALLNELADAGHTIILITHDPKVARQAHRIIEVKDGQILSDRANQDHSQRSGRVQSGTPTEQIDQVSIPDLAEADTDKGSSLLAGLVDSSRAAKRAMATNPVRTVLTLLGIIIGVAAVIVMLSIAEGAKRQITVGLNAFGTNMIYLDPISPSPQAPEGIISKDDIQALAKLPETDIVEPNIGRSQIVRYGNIDLDTYVRGGSPVFPILLRWPIEEGRFFTQDEYQRATAVAVIGQKIKKDLFPDGENPLGKFILIEQSPFQIVGVKSRKDADGNFDENDQITIPYTTAVTRLFGPSNPNWVTIDVNDSYPLEHTEQVIYDTLLRLHKGVEDFVLDNNAVTVLNQQKIIDQVSALLGAIAAVSLLVGGIGVMNVMLMSVRERTREIGIRMATGARPTDIMRQFLTESVLVSLVGGLIGILLAFALLFIAVSVKEDTPVAIVPSVVLGAFSCALVTGIVFGFAPAKRAARMDPVTALSND